MPIDEILYFSMLVLASVCAVFKYKQLDGAAKVFAIYIWLGLINEIVSWYFAKVFHTNMPVYAIYCLIEFGTISLYFNESIDVFKKNNIGIYIGIGGILLGIVNIIFIQGVYVITSYFLIFEGISIIGMGLFSFFRLLLKNDHLQLYKYSHFWLTTIILLFWSITFIAWSFYNYFMIYNKHVGQIVATSISVVGISFYLCINVVFLLYAKMEKRYE